MSKVQILPENIKKTFSQQSVEELENIIREISDIIWKKKSKNKKVQELRLLQQLNECVLPDGHLDRIAELLKKQKEQNELTLKEKIEFDSLIEEEQKWQLKRVHILGKLAKLKNVTIIQLARQLGLNPQDDV